MFVLDIFKALKIGCELSEPAKWKKTQWLTTIVGSALALTLKYVDPDGIVTPEMQQNLIEGICYFLVVINIYFTKATSKKI